MRSHLEEALERGRNPEEARGSFGTFVRLREESMDVKVASWLYSVRADAIFGWRQLRKRKVTSAAAILSLVLAIGACTAAFRIIDAVLLRPLPVADSDRLYVLQRQGIDPGGNVRTSDSQEYPLFRVLRDAVKDKADLIAIGFTERIDTTWGSDEDIEKVDREYVSGWMFSSFGLRPALGRLLSEEDDRQPGGHPYAVISYAYWTRRFGRDPNVIGRRFRAGDDSFEVVGVSPRGFTGTEPGTSVDVFVPTMMNPWVLRPDAGWFRILVKIDPGISPEQVLAQLRGPFQAVQEERAKTFHGSMSERHIQDFLHTKLLLEPAASGVSTMQIGYRRALTILGLLVALVLLIACANVANLMAAQAEARTREMALRVSIGAGRARLVQLMLMESAWIAFLAAALGSVFACKAAPFVVERINPPSHPVQLALPADWRVFVFALAMAVAVTLLLGLMPAVRASAVTPAGALKGGDDPHSKRQVMHALIGVQAAFCFLVLFISGLLVATFDRLSQQSPGFSTERLLVLRTMTQNPQPPEFWDQVADQLRNVPGVESAALSGWPLLSGTAWSGFIGINGGPPSEDLDFFLGVSPGWMNTVKMPLLSGRDIRNGELYPSVAIVNEAFAKRYFGGENPIGKWFEKTEGVGPDSIKMFRMQIVGVAADARYRNMREPITPTAFVPFAALDAAGASKPMRSGSFLVRTIGPNPEVLASTLRRAVAQARPGFRVSTVQTQEEIVQSQTVRERLLAMLASFFATVALLLASIGLYGVLDYSVLQRRREIAIRMAVGAQKSDITRRVTFEVISMVVVGSFAGLALGIIAARYVQALLYEVKTTEPIMLVLPAVAIFVSAFISALRPVIRAVRIEPAELLRIE